MANGLLTQKEETAGRLRPHDDDLATRSIVAAGEKAIYDPQVGGQLMQMVQAGNDPESGVGMALTVLLSNLRNSLVESGKGVPMDILFMKKGAAPVLAQCLADYADVPEAAAGAVPIAQQMMMQTDQMAMEGNAQQGQPQQEAPQGGPPQQPQATPQQGIMGGMG